QQYLKYVKTLVSDEVGEKKTHEDCLCGDNSDRPV
ncbi:unnamed protein product, partial [marine sediment metagenome]